MELKDVRKALQFQISLNQCLIAYTNKNKMVNVTDYNLFFNTYLIYILWVTSKLTAWEEFLDMFSNILGNYQIDMCTS